MREEESEKQVQHRAGEDRSGRKSLLPQIAICHPSTALPPPLKKYGKKNQNFKKYFLEIDLIFSQQ